MPQAETPLTPNNKRARVLVQSTAGLAIDKSLRQREFTAIESVQPRPPRRHGPFLDLGALPAADGRLA